MFVYRSYYDASRMYPFSLEQSFLYIKGLGIIFFEVTSAFPSECH